MSQHWAASDANDFELEHQIYQEDAVLEYPQSGERIRGRRNIQTTRTLASQETLDRSGYFEILENAEDVRIWQCAPKARITSGGGIRRESCRLIR